MPTHRRIYHEVVPAPAWVWLLLALTLVLSVLLYVGLREAIRDEAPAAIWLWDLIWVPSIMAMVVVPLLLARLEIHVGNGRLRVRFGWTPLIEKEIALRIIERAEPVTYRPIRQFGGWGIRRGSFRGKSTAVYSVRGSTGLLLELATPIRAAFVYTDRVLIGTLDAPSLAEYLNWGQNSPPADKRD